MTSKPTRQHVAAAVLLLREDQRAMLVQPGERALRAARIRDKNKATQWTLPLERVAETEVAEQALARLMMDRLHIEPQDVDFTDTFGVGGGSEPRLVVNVFTCTTWIGDPRYSESDFTDAAWVDVANASTLDVLPEVAGWLDRRFGVDHVAYEPPAMLQALAEAREELLRAFEEVPWEDRGSDLDAGWSPLDVLSHCGTVEAYYAAEARRLLDEPGHTWRPFNEGQSEAERSTRPMPTEEVEYPRLEAVRHSTTAWVQGVTGEQLAAFGNHPDRGAVQVGDRVVKIAGHDRSHAGQLRAMRETLDASRRGRRR